MNTSIATPEAPPAKSVASKNAVQKLGDSREQQTTAVLVGLRSRTFVVVWSDRQQSLRSAELLCRPAGEFKEGERVHYRGRIETVRSVTAY